jgi:hypothetical protein
MGHLKGKWMTAAPFTERADRVEQETSDGDVDDDGKRRGVASLQLSASVQGWA